MSEATVIPQSRAAFERAHDLRSAVLREMFRALGERLSVPRRRPVVVE